MSWYDNTQSFFLGGIAGGIVETFGEAAAGHGAPAVLGALLGTTVVALGIPLTGMMHEDSAPCVPMPDYKIKPGPVVMGGLAGALAASLFSGIFVGGAPAKAPTIPDGNAQTVEQVSRNSVSPALESPQALARKYDFNFG